MAIERNRYLTLCQKNSMYPGVVKVIYNGSLYHPVSYLLWFNGRGEPQNTAILHDVKSRSHTEAPLVKLFEPQKEENK